jgi:DNA-directed RNA polymerase specialized sigma24 family protein
LLTGDWHAAEDLVQDALSPMYRIWGGIGRIDNPAADAQTVLARQFLTRSMPAQCPSGTER